MELEGKKVNNKNQLKIMEKKLEEIEKEKKDPTATPAVATEKVLKEKVEKLKVEKAELDSTVVASTAAVDAEVKAKVKDLKEQLAKVEETKAGESAQLKKVQKKITEMVDVKEPEPVMKGGLQDPEKKKPDLSGYKENLAKIEKEEAAKEDAIEARAEAIKNVPKNPVVEAAEKA